MSQKHIGARMDDFLKEEGIFDEAQAQAVKEVAAWQLVEAMRKRKISKARFATLLKTSRTQVDRLLDPKKISRSQACSGRRPWPAAALPSSWRKDTPARSGSATMIP